MSPAPEASLRFDQKNPVELELAFRLHREAMLGLAYSRVRNVAEAEDVVQDAFVRLARSSAELHHPLRYYLFQIVVNLCKDRGRARSRARLTAADAAEDERGKGCSVADELIAGEEATATAKAVRAAVDAPLLTERERVVVRQHYFHDVTLPDIAVALGVSPDNVRHIVHRARLKLAPRLAHLCASTDTPPPTEPAKPRLGTRA